MIQKPVIYKRKFKAMLSLIALSALLFLGVFALCFGVWIFVKNHGNVKSPLAKIISTNAQTSLIVKIQNLCITTHINCTNITIHADNTATISIDTDEQVILSLQKDLTAQFTSLQLTIGHLTIEGTRFHRLDFRFDKPVISY